MLAVTWSALGLLGAVLFGSFFYLGNRIDALGAGLRGEIGDLRKELRDDMRGVNARLGHVNARLDGVNARLDIHLNRHPN
jgi:hypothetical protein